MAGLPPGLKRIGEAFQAKPVEQAPPPPAHWLPSGRVDGPVVKEGVEAERHFLDGPTDAEKYGFELQAQLDDAKRERQRIAREAADAEPPRLYPMSISPAMAAALSAAWEKKS